MVERVPDAAAAAAAFRTLADAEASRVPTYARICRVIAERPELHGLLLEAPTGQRLPVLLLAAIHDVVLRDPTVPVAPWYPSVTQAPPSDDDPTDALVATVGAHRDEIVDLLRTRLVQTNEVNRCVAWRLALGELCVGDPRPLALVEVGASAGLNLELDHYLIELHHDDASTSTGAPDSTVRLATELRTGAWPSASAALPSVVDRVGLDLHPLDVADPDDARWLAACIWPEQRDRFDRLAAAIALARDDPPRLVRGDMVDDIDGLVAATPNGAHVVVLASWALTYVERTRRVEFAERLAAAAAGVRARGGRLSLATLDAAHVLPWVQAPPIDESADADHRHASLLTVAEVTADGIDATPIAWTQAHLAWAERIA